MSVHRRGPAKIMWRYNLPSTTQCHLVFVGMSSGSHRCVNDGQSRQGSKFDGKFAWMPNRICFPALDPHQVRSYSFRGTAVREPLGSRIGTLRDGFSIHHDANYLVKNEHEACTTLENRLQI